MSQQKKSESFDTYNTCSNVIKNQILKEGIWKPYTVRIQNLIEAEICFWKLYEEDSNLENKRKVLEDIINLQPVIADWYNASKKIIELELQSEMQK